MSSAPDSTRSGRPTGRSRRRLVSVAFVALGLTAVLVGVVAASASLRTSPVPTAVATNWDVACARALGTQSLYQVEQTSMTPGYLPEDLLLLAPPGVEDIRGRVVVFVPPPAFYSDAFLFLKRVVAAGGDTVDLRNGRLVVNGVVADEPYLHPGDSTTPTGELSSWQVPPGQLFVLGDHRPNSADSRVFGPIAREAIKGIPIYRCGPGSRSGPIP